MKYIFKNIDELIITTTNSNSPSITKLSNINANNRTYEGSYSTSTSVTQNNIATIDGDNNLILQGNVGTNVIINSTIRSKGDFHLGDNPNNNNKSILHISLPIDSDVYIKHCVAVTLKDNIKLSKLEGYASNNNALKAFGLVITKEIDFELYDNATLFLNILHTQELYTNISYNGIVRINDIRATNTHIEVKDNGYLKLKGHSDNYEIKGRNNATLILSPNFTNITVKGNANITYE